MMHHVPVVDYLNPSASSSNLSNFSIPLHWPVQVPATTAVSTPFEASRPENPDSDTIEPATTTLYKMGAVMFPSGDPFAYPQQPLIGLTCSYVPNQPSFTGSLQPESFHTPDSMQFYMPSMFGAVEHGLLDFIQMDRQPYTA